MSMTVRRMGVLALAVGLGASLLHTSTSARPAFATPHRNLNLRLPSVAPTAFPTALATILARATSLAPATVVAPPQGVWAVRVSGTDPQALRATRTVDGPPALASAGRPDRVVAVSVTLGTHPAEPVMTNAARAGDMLTALGVRISPTDVVSPGGSTMLQQSAAVVLTRVRVVRRTVVVAVPFATVIHYSSDIQAWSTQVLTPGAAGSEQRTYAITYRNGREVSRTLLAAHTIAAAQDQVLLRGLVASSGPPSGTQYGEGTWYDFCPTDGLFAAHKTLPFGTHVTVTNLANGKSVTVVINDRGPYGPGRIIDLCPQAFAQIAPLSQGVADVRITW
jgi:rare lipoprotein A (RlpA)-like double-psi beta-barrel protein/surface rod structure-forming protein G